MAYTVTKWEYTGHQYHGHSPQAHMISFNVDIFCHPISIEPHGYHLVFIHPTDFDQFSGLYYLNYTYGNIEIITCSVFPFASLVVKQSIQLYMSIGSCNNHTNPKHTNQNIQTQSSIPLGIDAHFEGCY